MENLGILGTWINSKNPDEEILITDIGNDYYLLEYEKSTDGFEKYEIIKYFLNSSQEPYGLIDSQHFGRDSNGSCDGEKLKINEFIFIRKEN